MIQDLLSNHSVHYVGTAPCHTIGIVIANLDPIVRYLLQIPEEISSIGILSTRIGTGTVVVAIDEAVKRTNTVFLKFELSRDTEGYGGPGTLLVIGSQDVNDCYEAIHYSLDYVTKYARNIFINEVGHLEIATTARAGVVLNGIFGIPLNKAFGFTAVGPAGIGLVTADSILKESPIKITFIETPATLTYNNQVTVTFTGDYSALKKASTLVYDKWSALAATLGSEPESIYTFGQPDSSCQCIMF